MSGDIKGTARLLVTLNTFLSETDLRVADDWVLWHDIGSAPDICLTQVQHELVALRHKIESCSAQSWLLYSEDQHNFLLGFLALLGLKKKVVICANKKPEWLQSLSAEFDAILSDEVIDLSDEGKGEGKQKPCFNFELSRQKTDVWQPIYDGQEKIVFFTSGSTGHPKAIEKTLLALTNEVNTLRKTFADEVQDSVFIASVSHLHIYGLLFKLLLPLLVRAGSINQQIKYPEQLIRITEKFNKSGEHKKRVFISSPTFLSRLDLCLPPLEMKAVFSSGGPLSFAAAQDSQKYFLQLPIEVYGTTETGGIGYRQQLQATTAWTVFAGVELSMKGEGVELLSPNMAGCHAYLLDDYLELLPNGQFMINGRKDRIIKIAEKRISLTEIERFLEAQTSIQECVALFIKGKREVIACAVVLSEAGEKIASMSGQHSLIRSWKEAMQSRFEAVTIPRKWRILTEIPLNSQSKIDSTLLLSEFNPERHSH